MDIIVYQLSATRSDQTYIILGNQCNNLVEVLKNKNHGGANNSRELSQKQGQALLQDPLG